MARMVGVLVLASHEGDVSDFGHDVCKTHFVLRDLKGGRPINLSRPDVLHTLAVPVIPARRSLATR